MTSRHRWTTARRGADRGTLPTDLAATVARLAHERWGDAPGDRRAVIDLLTSELRLRAAHLFGPDDAVRLETDRRVIATASIEVAGSPRWLRRITQSLTRYQLWRAKRRLAVSEALERQARRWEDTCRIGLLALFDIEFDRGRRAAVRHVSPAATDVPHSTLEENIHDPDPAGL